jgi:hypothetical protein
MSGDTLMAKLELSMGKMMDVPPQAITLQGTP